MSKIKSGVIGTGFIGPAHVEAVRRLGYVKVAALAEAGHALQHRAASVCQDECEDTGTTGHFY